MVQPEFAGRSPWTRPTFLAAAALGVLVVLGALVVVLAPDDGPDDTHTTPPAVSSAATAPLTPTPAPTEATALPTVAPTDVEWRLLGQVALPYSASAGPRTVTATTPSGFAHPPTGALLAAAHLPTRAGLSAGKAVYEPTLLHQFVPNKDRDALLDLLRAAPQEPAAPGELSQMAGFRFVSYTPDAAVVELVDRAPGGTGRYFGSTNSLVWRDGDWMMVAPPGGLWTSTSHEVATLLGFVEWGAR